MTSITMGLLERAAEATARATDLAVRFGAWRGKRRQRLARRARFRHLLHLEDRILDDIGLERGTLQDAARLPLAVDAGAILRRADGRLWRRPDSRI